MVDIKLHNDKKIVLPVHHSASDWDILGSYTMDASIFVSAPTSIRFPYTMSSNGLICKNAAVLCLPQCQLISYFRSAASTNSVSYAFRVIVPPGSWSLSNCYLFTMRLNSSYWRVYEYVGGVATRYLQTSCGGFTFNVWYKFRVMMWLTEWGLAFEFDKWDGSKWVLQGDVLTFINPLFGSEVYQRVGVINVAGGSSDKWHDDTEIWTIG